MCSQNPVEFTEPAIPALKPLLASSRDGGPDGGSMPVHAVLGLAAEFAELCLSLEGALKASNKDDQLKGASRGCSHEVKMDDTASALSSSPMVPVLSALPCAVRGTLWRLALAQVMLQNCQQSIQDLAVSRTGSVDGSPGKNSCASLGSDADSGASTSASCSKDLPQMPYANLEQPLALEGQPLALEAQQALRCKATELPEELGEQSSMRKHLRDLQDEDPDCILLIREIQRLGFGPQASLTRHFGQFGPVKQVLVARSATAARRRSRIRPAGLGFVVMDSAAAASSALDCGERQVIAGTTIEVRVRRFKRGANESSESPEPGTWADISGF